MDDADGGASGSRSSPTLFLFIWFSNLIGYIPLPTNTRAQVRHLRRSRSRPSRSTRRRRTSRSRSCSRWSSGSPTTSRASARRARRLPQEPRARGRARARWPCFIFMLEFFSNFMRLISLSVRLFANILAGHLIILFMGGALVVLLGHRGARRHHAFPLASPSSSSRSAWSPRCRRSSSPRSLPSTSAAPSPSTTRHKGDRQWTSPSSPPSPRPRRAEDYGARRRQGHRPRRRRRSRRRGRRRRHRLHLRQGDRVRHPPARDARRDHVDPVAGLRAHRGLLLLRPRRRPAGLLPLVLASLTAIVLAVTEGGAEEEGGSFLVEPGIGLMVWTLLVFARRSSSCAKLALPQIAEALDKRQRAIEESIDTAERTQGRGRASCSRSTASACKEARAQAEEIVARARKAGEVHERESHEEAKRQARGAAWSRRAATSRPRRAARSRRSATRSPTSPSSPPRRSRARRSTDDDQRRLVEEALGELDFTGAERGRRGTRRMEEIAQVYARSLFEVARSRTSSTPSASSSAQFADALRRQPRAAGVLLLALLLHARRRRTAWAARSRAPTRPS